MAGNINYKFFETWSSDMAYTLGFITGDGSIHYHGFNGLKGAGYKLSICLQYKDIEILNYIRDKIAPNNIIYEYRQKGLLKSGLTRHQVNLVISSKILMDSLISLGVTPQKTGKEILPNIPEEFFHDYLRGLFDADGTISNFTYLNKQLNKYYTTNYWQIVSANKHFLEQIKNKIPIDTYISHYCPNCYKLQTRKKNNIKIIYKYLYNSAQFYLQRKYLKFQEII